MSTPAVAPTILVIDQSEHVLAATREVLEQAGYRVLTHSRPTGCVALILQEKPDVVLLEVNIGGDTISKLFGKAQPNGSTVVLLYSNLSAEAMQAKVATCGAHGFIRKTRDGVDFLRQLKAWLKPNGSSAAMQAAMPRSERGDEDLASGARRVARNVQGTGEWLQPDSQNGQERRSSGTTPIELPVVLFIDDDMETLSALRREVQGEPYVAEYALSGAQALRKILSANPPQLVVSDILMPDPGGAAVYQRAVAFDPTWATRFLFLTGAGLVSEVVAFLGQVEARALEKPVRGSELRRAIRRALEASPLKRASQE